MMNYIKQVLMYQEKMDPSVDEEGRFTCPRCKETMIAESGTVEDYKFCPLCGQRWKEDEEDGEEDDIC
jgi:tRNA(Ile2) C34 agmatinyltransferase TiaS